MTLGPLQDKVWLHLGAKVPEHAELLARRARGIVLQGPIRYPRAQELAHSDIPVMLQHDGRPLGADGTLFPDEDLVWLQHQTGKVALLSSRVAWLDRPGSQARPSLQTAVSSVQRFARLARHEASSTPVLAMFALDYRWLTTKAARQQLLSALDSVEGPVGIMLSKDQDPLDSAQATEGLIELVSGRDQVVILRCDHGALGALAYGAAGAAIGQSPSSRHYIPPGDKGWADFGDQTPRVFLPQVMAWWKGSRLSFFDGDPLFNDPCGVCNGASVARFEDEALAPLADNHSVACWSDLAAELAMRDKVNRVNFWLELCQRAYQNLDEIEDRHDGLPQPASKQLKGWLRSAGVPAF